VISKGGDPAADGGEPRFLTGRSTG
jgi:hypothetical protein